MNKCLYFTEEAMQIVEQYTQENSCSFSKAVNTLILEAHRLQEEKSLKDFLQERVSRIETGIMKLHKQLQAEGYQ
jgi:hypothetical protein